MTIASFTLARYPAARIPAVVAGVPATRRRLARTPGVVLARFLGTARGESTALAADLARWATFCVWEDEAALEAHLASDATSADHMRAEEVWTVRLRLLTATGRWGGTALAPPGTSIPDSAGPGPVAVLTRASIRLRALRRFYAAVPPVDDELLAAPGRLASVGMGEWPVATQGTFSLWRSADDFRRFAYGRPHHVEVVRRTRHEGWYAEDLFARFRPDASAGCWDGRDPLAQS